MLLQSIGVNGAYLLLVTISTIQGETVWFGCFTWASDHVVELGYFSMTELLQNRGKLGLPIERDVFFTPCRLSELRAKLRR